MVDDVAFVVRLILAVLIALPFLLATDVADHPRTYTEVRGTLTAPAPPPAPCVGDIACGA